jgi:hypothetical protein
VRNDYETYTTRFTCTDIDDSIRTHRLDHKKIPAVSLHVENTLNEETGEITTVITRVGAHTPALSLSTLLTMQWPTDVHFPQYYTSEEKRQQKSDPIALPLDIEFRFAAYDLDFGDHKVRPTIADFNKLVLTLQVVDYTPNIIYQTRGGARIIYLIDPINVADEFERHYNKLLTTLEQPLSLSTNGYTIDATKDWTRLFRAPWVVRDEVEEYDRLIRLFHNKVLDLRRFKVKEKKIAHRVVHNSPFDQSDTYLMALLNEMSEGTRNNNLFKAACHIYRSYNEDGIERWLDIFRERAESEGLTPVEIETVIRSGEHAESKESTHGQA